MEQNVRNAHVDEVLMLIGCPVSILVVFRPGGGTAAAAADCRADSATHWLQLSDSHEWRCPFVCRAAHCKPDHLQTSETAPPLS